MADDGGGDGAGLCDDEELRHVDQTGEEAAHQDHDPAVHRHLGPDGEGVDEGDDVEQHEGADGGLVEEQLHRVHLQLLAVARDPHGVQRRREDAREGEEDAEARGGLDVGVGRWQGVVVGDHADAGTGGDQGVDGVARECGLVEDEVHEGDGGREHDARDLVEGDGGEGEGEVRQDDVHGHGDGERDDLLDGDAARHEHGEARARECEEREPGDEEVEGGEGQLGEFEGGVGEDGLVREDLGDIMSLIWTL